jgi:hypothetical protein
MKTISRYWKNVKKVFSLEKDCLQFVFICDRMYSRNQRRGIVKQLSELVEQMVSERPVSWEQMPDISLYMDQIVSYMSRQLIDFSLGEKLTPAMINNYIKDGLLPRAEGKRYNREHVAYLTAICILKQIVSVRDTKVLLDEVLSSRDIQGFYGSLREEVDKALSDVTSELNVNMSREEMTEAALHLAVSAYSRQLICKRLVSILGGKTD